MNGKEDEKEEEKYVRAWKRRKTQRNRRSWRKRS